MDPGEIILFHLFFTLPVGLIELSEMVHSLPKDLFPSTLQEIALWNLLIGPLRSLNVLDFDYT